MILYNYAEKILADDAVLEGRTVIREVFEGTSVLVKLVDSGRRFEFEISVMFSEAGQYAEFFGMFKQPLKSTIWYIR